MEVKELMKTSKKPLLIFVAILCIVGSSLTAYAVIWPESNVVHVDMQYTVALTSTVNDSAITLNAAVIYNGIPARAGVVVDFYYSTDGGAIWNYVGSGSTDTGGVAQATYTVTGNGAYDFKAIATIP